MSDERAIELDLRDRLRHGVIVGLDDRVATIAVGEPGADTEEWYFPSAMVPTELGVDAPVVLEGAGRNLRILSAGCPAADERSVEAVEQFQPVSD